MKSWFWKFYGWFHSPKEALKEAAKIFIYHFMLFSDEKVLSETSDAGNEEFDEEVLHMRQLLKTKLVDMEDLSVRALNCLKAADVRKHLEIWFSSMSRSC